MAAIQYCTVRSAHRRSHRSGTRICVRGASSQYPSPGKRDTLSHRRPHPERCSWSHWSRFVHRACGEVTRPIGWRLHTVGEVKLSPTDPAFEFATCPGSRLGVRRAALRALVLRPVVVRVGTVGAHGSIPGSGAPRVPTEFELGGTVLTLICGSAGTDLDDVLRFTARTRDLFFGRTIAHSYHRASLFVARARKSHGHSSSGRTSLPLDYIDRRREKPRTSSLDIQVGDSCISVTHHGVDHRLHGSRLSRFDYLNPARTRHIRLDGKHD
jgi:hypothetical protein